MTLEISLSFSGNELIRRCLLRWLDARLFPTSRHRYKHLPGFSCNLRILLANSEEP